jgi:hypothetical protein
MKNALMQDISVMKEVLLAAFIGAMLWLFITLFLLLAPANGQTFENIETCNAHTNACVATVWQEWTYNWNPCAAEVSLRNYGLYLFGHMELDTYGDSWAMYNLYDARLPGEIQFFEPAQCEATYAYCKQQLNVAKANTEACGVTREYLRDWIGDNTQILTVAKRTWLAQIQGW